MKPMHTTKKQAVLLCLAVGVLSTISACSNSNDTSTDTASGTTSGDTGATTDGTDTTNTTGSTESTEGVACDYTNNTFNSSASVNLSSEASWACSDTERELSANGVPDHEVGTFPNDGNPNTITEQIVSATLTLTPKATDTATQMGGPAGTTAYVLNGVKIDASTAGTCDDEGNCSLIGNEGGWNIEALGQSSFNFGTDDNNAHVQPGGVYHYHGMPEGFITLQGGSSTSMTLVGWAADGFPIYARYGYSTADDASSALKVITGSYQLVSTTASNRPSTELYPLGTFQQDWEYIEGAGDLDECNGRTGVTPEFPSGIYHYFSTDSYPYFQRCVKGEVASTGTRPGGMPPAREELLFGDGPPLDPNKLF